MGPTASPTLYAAAARLWHSAVLEPVLPPPLLIIFLKRAPCVRKLCGPCTCVSIVFVVVPPNSVCAPNSSIRLVCRPSHSTSPLLTKTRLQSRRAMMCTLKRSMSLRHMWLHTVRVYWLPAFWSQLVLVTTKLITFRFMKLLLSGAT
jgi:hypothetical protein